MLTHVVMLLLVKDTVNQEPSGLVQDVLVINLTAPLDMFGME